MNVEQHNEPTARRSRAGCLAVLVIAVAASGWTIRLIVAIANNRNGCFSVNGKVVDEQGQVVKDALISSMTVISPFPNTRTNDQSNVIRTNAGYFAVRACDVG